MLDAIRTSLQTRTAELPNQRFMISAIYETRFRFSPIAVESRHAEHFVVVQTANTGVSFSFGETPIRGHTSLLGADCRQVSTGSLALQVACLDAGYAELPRHVHELRTVAGDLAMKAAERASIVATEVTRLMPFSGGLVHCIGAVGSIIQELKSRAAQVTASDLDDQLVGSELAGVLIDDGEELNRARIDSADVVLITGMSLANETFGELLSQAHHSDKPVVVFAQTAANIFPHLLNAGISTVISEPYPFYLLPGVATIRIYRSCEQSREASRAP